MMDPLEHLQMLKDRAAGIAPRKLDLSRIRALRFTSPGFDHSVWREMCQKGWLGLRVAEARGGSGGGAREFCGLAEQWGAELVPEPLIPAAMAAQLLPPDHLVPVLAGERIVLPAWQEEANSIAPAGDARLTNGRLTGRKILIPMAGGADAFLVTVPGRLALVERDAPGVSLQFHETRDGGNFATLILENAQAEAIEGDATEALEQMILANSAYLLGLADGAFSLTRACVKTREQFARKISGFQVLRDRIADLEIQIPLTRAAITTAADTLDTGPTLAQRQAAVSRAKLRASDAAMVVTRTCVNLCRALGFAMARDVELFLNKAMVLSPLHGSASVHRARFRVVVPETVDQ